MRTIASAPLTFNCSPILASSSGVTVNGKAVANGVASIAVTVVSINGSGMPAPGRPVILSSSIGALAATSGTTDAAGAFTTTITATAPGNGRISATVDGVALGCRGTHGPPHVTRRPAPESQRSLKSALDRGVAAVGLVLVSPLLAAVAVWVFTWADLL